MRITKKIQIVIIGCLWIGCGKPNKQESKDLLMRKYESLKFTRNEDSLTLLKSVLDTLISNYGVSHEFYNVRGLVHFNLEHYDNAIRDFSKAINYNKEVLTNRSQAYALSGKIDSALIDEYDYHNWRKDTSTHFSRIGNLFALIEDYSRAKTYYDSSLLFGETKVVYLRRALVNYELNDTLNSCLDLKKCDSMSQGNDSNIKTMMGEINCQEYLTKSNSD